MPNDRDPSAIAPAPDHIAGPSTVQSDAGSVCQWLTDMLVELGCKMAFGVTGGPIAPITDALSRSALEVVHTRHESAAVFSAIEASFVLEWGQVVFVTTGPGLYNALNGVAAAKWEGAHLILLSGTTSAHHCGRLAAQETSPMTSIQSGIYTSGPLFDYAIEIHSAAQLPQVAARLFEGLRRPQGFVAHLALPVAIQTSQAHSRYSKTQALLPEPGIDTALVDECISRLSRAPFVLWAGFGARHAAAEIHALVEKTGCLVMSSPHAKGLFPESDPHYLGQTGLGGHESVERAFEHSRPNTILVLGSRLGESTSYWDTRLCPSGEIIHVDVNRNAFQIAFPDVPCVGIVAEVRAFLRALLLRWPDSAPKSSLPLPDADALPRLHPEVDGPVRPQFLLQAINDVCIDEFDALIMSEAGNSFAWCNHYLRFQKPNRYRTSPHYGSMGHFVSGVVGAAIARRGKAVAVVGDGAMLMLNEITTAVRYRANVVWIVINDSQHGSVKHGMHALGYEPLDTALPPVDFAAFAVCQGARGIRIKNEASCHPALRDAMRLEGPVVVDVLVDPTIPSPLIRRIRSLQAQGANRFAKDDVP